MNTDFKLTVNENHLALYILINAPTKSVPALLIYFNWTYAIKKNQFSSFGESLFNFVKGLVGD